MEAKHYFAILSALTTLSFASSAPDAKITINNASQCLMLKASQNTISATLDLPETIEANTTGEGAISFHTSWIFSDNSQNARAEYELRCGSERNAVAFLFELDEDNVGGLGYFFKPLVTGNKVLVFPGAKLAISGAKEINIKIVDRHEGAVVETAKQDSTQTSTQASAKTTELQI